MEFRASSLEEIPSGGCKLAEANGTRVVLARVGPLSEGKLAGARLTCPWHGWLYDVRTGQCLLPTRGAAVATYAVRIEGGDIWVEVP